MDFVMAFFGSGGLTTSPEVQFRLDSSELRKTDTSYLNGGALEAGYCGISDNGILYSFTWLSPSIEAGKVDVHSMSVQSETGNPNVDNVMEDITATVTSQDDFPCPLADIDHTNRVIPIVADNKLFIGAFLETSDDTCAKVCSFLSLFISPSLSTFLSLLLVRLKKDYITSIWPRKLGRNLLSFPRMTL